MSGLSVVKSPLIVNRLHRDVEAERAALVADLRASPPRIAFKYFYDALGCALFGAICELDEYYPTRTEQAIFALHGASIAAATGTGVQLVDLGAGDGRKAEQWLGRLAARRYVAVDIAEAAVQATLARLALAHPALDLLGVVTDFTAGLELAADLLPMPTLFFYPGSSIGNFAPEEAVEFMRQVRRHVALHPGSGLLIGVDTKKEAAVIEAAYDDALGVTAAFNRNALRHVNAVLGSNFKPGAFAHVALYDDAAGRVEMHLESTTVQDVQIDGVTRRFAAGERILTEHSYKYAPAEFERLLHAAGFGAVRCWQDPGQDFAVFYAC